MFRKAFSKNSKPKDVLLKQSEIRPFFSIMYENIVFIQNSFVHTEDLIIDSIADKGALLYIHSLVDLEKISDKVLTRIQESEDKILCDKIIFNLDEVNPLMLDGYSIFISKDKDFAYAFNTSTAEKRSIQEPLSEKVLRGSHDGFIESLATNIQLVRLNIKSENLCVKYMTVGEKSHTKIAIVFLDDVINKDIVKELERRLSYLKVDYIQSPGSIQEFIEDEAFSPFPQMLNTERPDRVVANLMEGRFVILTEGNPTAMIAPINFFAFFQSPDDYNSRWLIGLFIRLFRVISFMIAIGLPALYIAVVSFHYEVIPFELVFTLKGTLEHVPILPIFEALSMHIILELLSEAATRLPSPIAQTIGVVGGLVIGTAVVEANLVSNSMIVVVALTAVASYAIPVTEMGTTIRILGFPLMIAAAIFGFIGIVIGLMLILVHLCKLESFGSPYFSPLAPFKLSENKDTIFRFPLWSLKKRPTETRAKDMVRLGKPREWKQNE